MGWGERWAPRPSSIGRARAAALGVQRQLAGAATDVTELERALRNAEKTAEQPAKGLSEEARKAALAPHVMPPASERNGSWDSPPNGT